MANEEHLRILREEVEQWNQWRKDNPEVKPDLCHTNLRGLVRVGIDLHEAILISSDLRGSSFHSADLRNAILSAAVLCGCDLRNAKLIGSDLRWGHLQNALLRGTDLRDADLSRANLTGANLVEANLSQAKFYLSNLTCAKLARAELSNADFKEANLSNAELILATLIGTDFTGANLTEAGLTGTQALSTNFEGAILTGACIEDWHIHEGTNLNGVICEYVYFKNQQQERQTFEPGEFTQLFQELENVVQLIFRNGMNWRAFAFAFNEVNTKIIDADESGEMFLREYKVLGDGLVALKVATPPRADKIKIRDELNFAYEKILRLEGELKGKDAILAGVMDRLFSMTGDTYNNHIYGNPGNFANKLEDNARQQANQYNIGQKQTLIEVAQEIQQIYDQLLQAQSDKTVDDLELAKQLRAELEKQPTLKERLVGALKSGGAEALKSLVNRIGFSILLETWRGWQNPE